MKTEPVTITMAILGFLSAVLNALVAFGVQLSDVQRGAVLGLADTAMIIVALIVMRRIVWSPASVEKMSSIPGTTTTIRPPAPPPEAA